MIEAMTDAQLGRAVDLDLPRVQLEELSLEVARRLAEAERVDDVSRGERLRGLSETLAMRLTIPDA